MVQALISFVILLVVVGIIWFIAKAIVQKVPTVVPFAWIVDIIALLVLLLGAIQLFLPFTHVA